MILDLVALDLESVRSRMLVRKLSFLKRQLECTVSDLEIFKGVGIAAMRSLADNPESLCLVKECRELEDYFGTSQIYLMMLIPSVVEV